MTSSNTAFWSGEPSARGRAGFRLLPPLQEGRSLSLQAFDVLLTAVVWVRRDVVRIIARVLAVVINEAVLVLVVSGRLFGDVASCGGIYCEWMKWPRFSFCFKFSDPFIYHLLLFTSTCTTQMCVCPWAYLVSLCVCIPSCAGGFSCRGNKVHVRIKSSDTGQTMFPDNRPSAASAASS